ncbi:hypothetical protein AVEN_108394-1 [Araneus ventricosus]|uniref:Integrase catalytic domain-containing protein n=1 Tax=Araneus ventricosus TaxID=182803 RepID=A0A4Y2CVK3_ARAVE|nr:hypothetical protein AVEN_108394-1 [Araneus ventricosus]
MGLGKTREQFQNSFFSEGMRVDVKYCDSGEECQITQTVKTSDNVPSTPVAEPELSGQVGKIDLVGLIDPLTCVLWIVDQHTRWGETTPLTSLKDQVTCEVSLSIFSKTGKC